MPKNNIHVELGKEEKYKFVLDRVRLGLSSTEIQRQLVISFPPITKYAAQKLYLAALDSVIAIDKSHRAQHRVAMVEILHGHLTGIQQDITNLSTEIQMIKDTDARRSALYNVIFDPKAKAGAKANAEAEVRTLARFPPQYYLNCLDRRVGFRMSAVKVVTELGRLHGLYVEEMPIIRAIQVMANSELIPSATASTLINLLAEFETAIDKIPVVSDCN
jgi:hypothetical protein